MLFILNRQEKVVGVLKNSGKNSVPFFNDLLTEDLATGSETFEFTTVSRNGIGQHLVVGNFIAFKKGKSYKLFQIMQTEEDHQDELYITVYAECAGLQLINSVFRGVKIVSASFERVMQTLLSDTSWNVGILPYGLATTYDLDIEQASVYSLLQTYAQKYGVELEFRVEINRGKISKKYIDGYYNRGKVTGKRFTYERDIEGIVRKTDATELYTALIGKGNNGISFKDVTVDGIDKPMGQDFVANQSAYEKYNNNGYHIVGIYECDTDDAKDLLRKTHKRLLEVSEPKVEYDISVLLLCELLGEKWNEVAIGDVISVFDNAFYPPIMVSARVSKLQTSMTDKNANKCTLANFIEVKSNITSEMRKIASQLQGYVDNRFPIGSSDIQDGAVGMDQISDIYTQTITTDILRAGKVETEKLIAQEAEITNAKIENLKAGFIEADEIITDTIIANKAEFDVLEAKVGKIDTLVNGNLSSENIQTGGITGNNLNMDTIFVKDANILDISASKLTAGEINTSKIAIVSEDGGIRLVGATQQFVDENNRIRIQLGKDAEGNFDFYILAENGDILFNTRGITGNAIENGLIKEDMVSDGAIGGKKINWQSFVTEFNKDSNTHKLNSSKVLLDGTNQTLDVHFNSLKSTVDENVSQTESNTTQLNVHQGKINTLIQDTTIAKDGQNLKLKDEYSKLEQTVSGIKTSVGQQQTTIDQHTGKITATESKVSTLEQSVNGFSSELSHVKTTVDKKVNADEVYKKNETMTTSAINSAIKQSADSIKLGVSETYETKVNVETKVNNAINNVQVGGRNIFRCSGNFGTSVGSYWTSNGGGLTFDSSIKYNGYNTIKTTVGTGITGVWYKLEPNVEYTYSALVRCNTEFSGNGGNPLHYWAGKDNVNQSKISVIKYDTLYRTPNKWKLIYITFKLTDDADSFKPFIYWGSNTSFQFNIAYMKLEKGNKPSDWTPAPEDIYGDIENIQFGGRNIATHTNQGTTGWVWNMQAGGKTITEVVENGIRCCKMVRDNVAQTGWSYIAYNKIGREKYLPNRAYTISLEVKSSVATQFNCSLVEGNASNGLTINSAVAQVPKANTWTKLSFTLTTKDTLPTSTAQCVYLNTMSSATGVSYMFRNLMIEEGTRASAWSPAPEDVQAGIDAKANSADVYKKVETYTKTETDSAIKVAKDEINLGVKNTYETKTNVETKVNNAVTGLKVGGNNLLRNSNFAYDMANWSIQDMNSGGSGKSVIVSSGGDWIPAGKKALQIRGTNTTDRYGVISSTMKLIPNTKYTISGYCAGHRVNKIQVNVRDVDASSANIHTVNIEPAFGGNTLDKWYRFETTFTTTANTSFSINLYSLNFANNGYVWFTDVQLQQGTKATAWTPCSEDVDSAINSKANSSEVYTKAETYTKSETDSKINVAKNDITLAVSNTYETKTNVETKVNDAVNSIQVGGRNLLRNTSLEGITFPYSGSDYNWRTASTNDGAGISRTKVAITDNNSFRETISGIKVVNTTSANNNYDIAQDNVKMEDGATYTMSAYFKVTSGNPTWRLQYGTNPYPVKTGTAKSGWNKCSYTFKYDKTQFSNKLTTNIYFGFAGTNFEGYICGFKLEKGNKATDWSPAPEDVDSAIGTKANSADVYKKTEVYTRAETNSQINVAKDSITSTVSQNYVTKSDATNTYATKSSLTQTTNSITAKFEGSGGYNLLKNSGFKNEYAHWNLWHHNNPTGGKLERVLSSTTWGYPDASVVGAQIRLSNQSNIEYGIAQSFNTTIGKQYTLSFQYAGHRVSGANAIIRGANGSWLAHKYFTPTDFAGGNDNVNKWGTYSLTFTATATSHTLNIVITSAQNDGYLWVAKPQIVEGTVALPYSPHPSEIYEGSTIIDATGVTINNGAIKIKNNAGSTVLSGDTSGNLTLAGNITSSATIKGGTISGGTVTGGTLKSTNGDMYFDMNNGYMILYNNGTRVGQTNKNNINGTSIYGVSNGAEYGSYACLSAKTSSGASTYQMMLTATGSDLSGTNFKKGVTLGNTFHSNNWHFRLGSSTELCWRQSGSNHDSFITEGSDGMLRLFGDNGMYLGYRVGNSNTYVIAIRENGSHVYPKSLSVFDGDRPATDYNGYSLEIGAPLNMRGHSINQCSNIKTLGLEVVEPIAFNRDGEDKTRTLKVTKSTQNIVEFIGSAAIKNGEAIVDLPSDVSFKNYVVLLTPIGLDRKVSIVEKNDDNFKIVGDDGIVDYVIKFESMDYASYISKSISEDNTDVITRSEEDKPKEIFVEN